MYAQMSYSHYGGVPSSPYHYDRSLSGKYCYKIISDCHNNS